MKNIKTYNEMNETFLFNKFNRLQNKVKSDLGLNLYFATTFGTVITAMFPLFSKLVKTGKFTNITDTDIVLLIFGALSIILKENSQNIEKLKNAINERGLSEIIKTVTINIENILKLFKNIASTTGKTINSLVDMLSYTSLFVPFLLGLLDVIELYKINFTDFNKVMMNPTGIVLSTSVGVLTITLKHIVNIIMRKIFRKIKSKKTPSQINDVVQFFESVEIICENYFLSI